MSTLSGQLQLEDLIAQLSPTLGQEAATTVVVAASRSLMITGTYLSLSDAFRVLDMVGLQGGVIGATCRFAKQRLQSSMGRATVRRSMTPIGVVATRVVPPATPTPFASPQAGHAGSTTPFATPSSTASSNASSATASIASSSTPSTPHATTSASNDPGHDKLHSSAVTRNDIAAIIAPALGEEKAREVVGRIADKHRFGPSGTVDEALAILETLALEPGIVGVTARFGKAQLILRH